MGRIIFITGTGTGVGKTVVTGLLLAHLRGQGRNVLALKPFCSGGTEDVELLETLQDGVLKREEINPWYFPEPVAPLVSARWHRRRIRPETVVRHIQRVAERCKVLLLEGSGGLLVPLAPGFDVRDLIGALNCEVVVVAEDRLGTINHTRLTLEALCKVRTRAIHLVLRGVGERDASQAANAQLLAQTTCYKVFAIPYLGRAAASEQGLKKSAKKFQKTLAMISG
jgi:dethiobiotin synthetase